MATSRGNGTISTFHDSQGELHVCVKNDRNVGSFGVFYGDNPLTFVLPSTICQLFIFISITRVLYFLLRPLKTPKFICNVLGGIFLGPSFLGRNKTLMESLFPARQFEFLVLTSLIGVSYFVFMEGLKMDILMTIRAAKSTWRLGVLPFLTCFSVLLVLLNLYDDPKNLPLYELQVSRVVLSVTMSVANFPVMSEALSELNLITTELGQITLSSSMINDSIQWFLILADRIMSAEHVKISIAYFTSWVLFMLFSIFMLRPAMKLIARTTPFGKPVKQIYVVLVLLGALVMAGVSDFICVTFVMGPLLYGLVMPSGPPLGTTLVEKSEVIITQFLLPFFFMSIGIKTNFGVLSNWRKFLKLLSIFLAGDLAKVVACVLVSLTYKIKARHGMVFGLMMNIKGITQLITVVRMAELKLLDEETLSHIVLCVVVMTAIVTPLVRLFYKHSPRVLNRVLNESNILHKGEMLTIQCTPRSSEFRIVTCVHNEGNIRGIITLLEACNPVLESPLCVYVIHLVELLGKSAPIFFPIKHTHNRKFLSVNYPDTNHIMRAFEIYSRNSSGPVSIFPFVNVAPYNCMHNVVCNLTQDKMVPLLIIPFHENDHIDLDGYKAISIRKMNSTFQVHAPCTLGILVDRFSRLDGRNDPHYKLYFHVGIFFIGGPDDREALSLGIRMSERASTRVSLFQIIIMNKKGYEEDYVEDMLDEGLIDEYKGARFKAGNVSWYEITVEDEVEVLDAIRGWEGTYDLVMVGRRHKLGSLNDEETTKLTKNTEILGILGDMLSSTEFCTGMVPVLVTKCGGDMVHKFDRVGSVSNASETRTLLEK